MNNSLRAGRACRAGASARTTQLFLIELAQALGAGAAGTERTRADGDYVFERTVTFREPDGTASTGFIDLYKKGCFVLEAKQSRQKGGKKRPRPDRPVHRRRSRTTQPRPAHARIAPGTC